MAVCKMRDKINRYTQNTDTEQTKMPVNKNRKNRK